MEEQAADDGVDDGTIDKESSSHTGIQVSVQSIAMRHGDGLKEGLLRFNGGQSLLFAPELGVLALKVRLIQRRAKVSEVLDVFSRLELRPNLRIASKGCTETAHGASDILGLGIAFMPYSSSRAPWRSADVRMASNRGSMCSQCVLRAPYMACFTVSANLLFLTFLESYI